MHLCFTLYRHRRFKRRKKRNVQASTRRQSIQFKYRFSRLKITNTMLHHRECCFSLISQTIQLPKYRKTLVWICYPFKDKKSRHSRLLWLNTSGLRVTRKRWLGDPADIMRQLRDSIFGLNWFGGFYLYETLPQAIRSINLQAYDGKWTHCETLQCPLINEVSVRLEAAFNPV